MTTTLMPKTSERRLYQRFSARFPAKFKDSRQDFGSNVFLRNASASGIQIATLEKLFAHDHVALEVELPDGFSPMPIAGEVVWVRQSQPNIWEAGLNLNKTNLVRMSRLYKFTLE